VPILNEGLVEGTRTFTVTLSNPRRRPGRSPTATVEHPRCGRRHAVQFVNYNAASGWPLAEDVGAVLIGVVRGDDANLPVTVDIGTSDDTATNGGITSASPTTSRLRPQKRLKFVPSRSSTTV